MRLLIILVFLTFPVLSLVGCEQTTNSDRQVWDRLKVGSSNSESDCTIYCRRTNAKETTGQLLCVNLCKDGLFLQN